MEKNSKERSAKIKEHVDYYNKIREVGVIEACKQGVIKSVGCSVSGGKDSLATLLWAKNNIPPGIEIVGSYVKTPLENTDLTNYINYISRETGISINIYQYTEEEEKKQIELFIKTTIENGPPFKVRNCEAILKEPLYKKFNKKTDISLIGIRWRESQLRQNATKLFRYAYQIYYHPIIGWSKLDVFNYIKDNKIKLYKGYKYADRLGCSICPLGMAKKNCNQIYFISKMRDCVDWDFYYKWYSAMENFKYDRSGESFVKRLNYLKSNYRKLKELLKLPYEDIKIQEYDPPVFGWF
jgi:3'-phosphoadenosine 5'-phosphosulfate sulfotransferase (PAPS reductase)/FAD synthetase